MTQPQQEYIITENQIEQIGQAMTRWYLPDAGISLCRLLRSRPAPAPEDQLVWMTPEEEEKRIRKAERERVLDELIEEYDKLAMEGWNAWKLEGWNAWKFKEIMKSLREHL